MILCHNENAINAETSRTAGNLQRIFPSRRKANCWFPMVVGSHLKIVPPVPQFDLTRPRFDPILDAWNLHPSVVALAPVRIVMEVMDANEVGARIVDVEFVGKQAVARGAKLVVAAPSVIAAANIA